jgi:hypothetical protein
METKTSQVTLCTLTRVTPKGHSHPPSLVGTLVGDAMQNGKVFIWPSVVCRTCGYSKLKKAKAQSHMTAHPNAGVRGCHISQRIGRSCRRAPRLAFRSSTTTDCVMVCTKCEKVSFVTSYLYQCTEPKVETLQSCSARSISIDQREHQGWFSQDRREQADWPPQASRSNSQLQ